MDRLILQTVLDLSDDMFILVGPDQRVQWLSNHAARIGGIHREDAVGRTLCDLFPDAHLQSVVNRVLSSGQARQTTVKVGVDGLEMQARVVPVVLPKDRSGGGEAGNGDKLPASASRAHAEQDTSANDADVKGLVVVLSELELEKRLQTMRREFVANVSHELRSPLTSILGYAETLLHDPPEDEELRHRFLTSVVREARRMQRLVEDLLNLSRIESGQAAPQYEGANLHNIVGRVLTQLRDQAERSGVTLTNDVPPDLRLECDPGQIEQVIYNLVSNGIQYTPAGGSVTVSGWADEESVFMRVTDTGIGIPAADLPRVFERFYRVDKARSRATGATGLGLSIVKHIVDAHRGKVSVESEPGAGASFTVELPATRPAAG